jgi:hypothetical protein
MTKLVVIAALLAGCAATKRDTATYRADTQKVLATRTAQMQSCYDDVLKKDAAAAGTLTVRFIVEKKTGKFVKATIDPAKTTASEPLINCVLNSIDGLALAPADTNEGQATFVYELKPAAPAS